MSLPLSRSDQQILIREADVAARRISRRLNLGRDDLADLRQDLLCDALVRLRAYDPERGSLGAFAATVMRHAASRIAMRLHRQRQVFPVVQKPVDPAFTINPTQSVHVNAMHAVEQRIDLACGLARLDPADRNIVILLCRSSAHEVSAAGAGSRSGLYRQARNARLALLAAGVGAGRLAET